MTGGWSDKNRDIKGKSAVNSDLQCVRCNHQMEICTNENSPDMKSLRTIRGLQREQKFYLVIFGHIGHKYSLKCMSCF